MRCHASGAVVADAGDAQQRPARAERVTVEEGVAGVRVLLDVVRHAGALEPLLEGGGGPAQRAVLAPVTRDDRAGAAQGRVEVLGQMRVVRGRDVEPAGGHEREAAPHAEPDHADPPRAVLPRPQPLAHDLDVVEGRALAAQQRAERRPDAAHGAAGAVEVGGDGEVAGGRQPVGLLADVVDQAEGLVEHDDARPGRVADGRHGEVGGELRR